jgi:hypothetical protein
MIVRSSLRFYRAFRAFKRGRPQNVEELHRRALAELDRLSPAAKER